MPSPLLDLYAQSVRFVMESMECYLRLRSAADMAFLLGVNSPLMFMERYPTPRTQVCGVG